MRTTTVKSIRATPEQWATIEANAKADGLSVNAYVVRQAAVDRSKDVTWKPGELPDPKKLKPRAKPSSLSGADNPLLGRKSSLNAVRRRLGYDVITGEPIYADPPKPKKEKKS